MTKATPESADSMVFECDFEEPPEKVWRALTEPRLLDVWLSAAAPDGTRDHFMTAAEAKEWGLVDHVYSSREALSLPVSGG